MTPAMQKRLAIAGALLCVGAFVAANLHLVVLAIRSQPACTLLETGQHPARRDC
jgi:hypothetical protein